MERPQNDIFDISRFGFKGEFDEQVEEVLSAVRLSRHQVEHLQVLLDDLWAILSTAWPDCKLHPFGSIVTGLGIKTSDIDCFAYTEMSKYEDNPVMKAKHMLYRFRNKFANLFAITTAKVPILKFEHIQTGFQCDLNFSSYAGVENSQLIAVMANSDIRVLQLMIIVKYWSKVCKLTGTNLLPNYALTLMVIVYLQEVSVLPSVQDLQQGANQRLVDHWNIAFNKKIPPKPFEESLYELLGHFFGFYASFDFGQYIICPYLGTCSRREAFARLETVPSDFRLYRDNVTKGVCRQLRLDSSMCVQDPFDHSRNCAVCVSPRLLEAIKTHFQMASDAYNNTPSREFLRTLLSNGENMAYMPAKQNNTQKQKTKKRHLTHHNNIFKAKRKEQGRKHKTQIKWYQQALRRFS